MKKTIFTIALLLGLSTSYAVTKMENTPNVPSNEIKINTIKKGTRLTVKDTKEIVIYSEIITKNASLTQNFDFTNLKNGTYTIELTHDFEVQTQKISVASKKVTFLEDTSTQYFKPLIRQEKNKVYVSKLELSENAIAVKLFFEGEEIHSEKTEGETIFERVYTLDATKSGNYSVLVQANDRNYTTYFNL